MIKDFTPRLYQETILSTTVNYNTLVVLPTGMGKTFLCLMLAAQRLTQYPNSKILILSPTKPLCQQHQETFKKHFDIDPDKVVLFTGHVPPEKRAELWNPAQVIISTPQGLTNDVISNKIPLEDISLIVFDESHRAVGDYDYVFLAKQYNKKATHPRILALTASPGSDLEKISEVCKNLYIEEIEVRTDQDPDVQPYIQEVKINWVNVELPETFKQIKKFLEDCYVSKLIEIKKFGYLHSAQLKDASKTELLRLQASLHSEIARGDKSFEILKSVSYAAEAMKIQHGLELLETQSTTALYNYLTKLQAQSITSKVKAVKNLVRDINFRSALIKTSSLVEKNIEHPKLYELQNIVKEEVNKNKEVKIIIFTQFRDTATKIKEFLDQIEGVTSQIFVGQTKKGDTGMSQKVQIETLNNFRQSKFNTLIATSIAEEGLDIIQVDLVIFYEPIPSAIRTIQRKGRTGRQEKGRVITLMTKNTRDEGYRWSAHHKEKRMYRTLDNLKSKLSGMLGKSSQPTLNKFLPEGNNIKIFADYREKGSGIIKELVDMGININLEQMQIGDYLVSSRACIELKTTEDFVNSIIDGRLLQQIKELKQNYERPVVVVEGEQDIYSIRNIHPNAIRGMLATIAVSYGIPIIYTKNSKETASLLALIAKREQTESGNTFSLHGDKKPMTLAQQQEYLISALPNIGLNLAKDLLLEFKSVKNIINASEEELKKVEKMGDKKSSAIKQVVETEYGA